MRGRLSLAMAVATIAGAPAAASEDWHGGFLLAAQERTVLQDTPLNPGNFLGIREHATRLAALAEGSQHGFTWRVRAEALSGSGGRLSLQELNRVFQFGEGLSLSLGKRLYALDPSYINQPLGFLQKRTDLSDPLDALGNAEGVPMAVLGWSGARASAAALHARESGGRVQSLLKLGYEFDAVGASVLLRRPHGGPAGVGVTVAGTATDAVSWYLSAYRARGVDGYSSATAGVVYTPEGWPKVQIEYAYDGLGLSETRYAALRQGIDAAMSAGLPQAVLRSAQAKFAARLQGQGARQHYASLTLSRTLGAWEVGGGIYAGLDDSSRVWHGQLDYAMTQRTRLMLSAVWQQGAEGSERELSPVGAVLAARIRWAY